MTTAPGQDPRPGSPRGPARPDPRGADRGWPRGSAPRRPPADGRGLGDRDADWRGGGANGRGGSGGFGDSGGYRGSAPGTDPRLGRYPAAMPRRSGPLRWVGTLPAGWSSAVVAASGATGLIGTIVTKTSPGALIIYLLIAGSVIASAAVRRDSAQWIIPVPAVTYLVAVVAAGYEHDKANLTSRTELGLNFASWIGSGFVGVVAATVLVLLIFGARLLVSRQLVSGDFGTAASQRGPAAPRPARAPRGSWDSDSDDTDPRMGRLSRTTPAPWPAPDPRGDRDPRGRGPRVDEQRRGDRDSRDDRDPRARRDGRDPRGGPGSQRPSGSAPQVRRGQQGDWDRPSRRPDDPRDAW